MKKIVIVGGGIAGKKLAETLSRKNTVETILVEPREYMEVPFAQLRALVEPKNFSPSIRKEYSRLLPGVHHIQKKAAGVKGKKLLLDDGSSQEFDYLVIASGSSFKSWSYLKSSETGLTARQEEVEKESAKLENAESVLIVGGGAVGVELAGEIAYKWPNKKIRIANSGSRILNGLSQKMSLRSENLLKEMGVEILNNTRLTENSDTTWKDEKGSIFKADIVYPAVGININSQWLENSDIERDERAAVKVGTDLRVLGSENIFALGDVNDIPEQKLGALASIQANLTAKNILSLIKNPEARLKPYKPGKTMGFIPIGQKSGAVQLPFGHPHFMIAMKQKDLFASMYLKEGK